MITYLLLVCATFLSSANDLDQPRMTYKIDPIYAPWRDNYYQTFVSKEKPLEKKETGCRFCTHLAQNEDEKHLILYRGKSCALFLNLFPYSKGHMLIFPYQHAAKLSDFPQETLHEMMDLTQRCTELLHKLYNCSNFHVGFNIGPISGASMPDHIHMQIVPRYPVHQAFIHTIAQTEVICFDIARVYKELKKEFDVQSSSSEGG